MLTGVIDFDRFEGMEDERFDLLTRMAFPLGLELTVGETDEHNNITTVCVCPASDPEGPPEPQVGEVSILEIYTWLLGYEAAIKQLGK